jgi:hypothetical protein
MEKDIVQKFRDLSAVPESNEAFNKWLHLKDAFSFMKENATGDEVVLYGIGHCVFIHAVLAKTSAVTPPDVEDLLSWSFNASASWGVWTTLDDKEPSVSMCNPLDDERCKSVRGGEQLVFARDFEGRVNERSYYELLQKFACVSGLHFLSERNAYCRLNEQGDVEEVVRIIRTPKRGEEPGSTLITVRRNVIDRYAALTFDFTRFRPSDIPRWDSRKDKRVSAGNMHYRMSIQSERASYARGVHLIAPRVTKNDVARYFRDGDTEEKQYVSFIAHDWKNKCVREISCAPGKTANYFTQSDLPFETSPAFFRPDVLVRYKADSDKYSLRDRTLNCRGGWSLQSYDINEAGQVHAYICDLRHLPFEEQQHWKAYNEPPKAPISKRAFTNDFEGEWDTDYDPLDSLRHELHEWQEKGVPWWRVRNEKLLDQINYPVTTSADEWANELLLLDQLVVEGFDESWLKSQAQQLKRPLDIKWRSLRIVQECLIGLGFEEDHSKATLSPLQELHLLRSKLKGHASGNDATQIKQDLIKQHGSYKAHYRYLAQEADKAIRTIKEAFKPLRSK